MDIRLINAEEVTRENAAAVLGECDGIRAPGGSGNRASRANWRPPATPVRRTSPIGHLPGDADGGGEFARDVSGYADADSYEFDEKTTHPVIHLMDEQREITEKGGTMRLEGTHVYSGRELGPPPLRPALYQ